ERGAGRETLGDRPHTIGHQAALLPGSIGGRRLSRLDADHAHGRVDRLGGDASAGGAAAAADWHDDQLDVGLLLEDLERLRRDARDQVWLVARVNVSVAMLAGELFAVLAGFVEVLPVGDDLGAEA